MAGGRGGTGKDVAVDDQESPSVIRIHLRRSKTDQFGRGVDIYLGATGDELCPVAALLAYLAVRGGEDGPLFRFRDCRALTREVFVDKVRSALSILGYDASTYAGHNFRIGAATTGAEKGIEDSVIKMLGIGGRVRRISYMCSFSTLIEVKITHLFFLICDVIRKLVKVHEFCAQ